MSARLRSPNGGRVEHLSAQRVLSVSPSRMQADAFEPATEAGMPMHTSTPPQGHEDHNSEFVDSDSANDIMQAREEGSEQPSLDRFAAELSAMIEVAATTADALNRRLHEASEGENRAAAASVQLQEQLRLGARMLKAFQSQIARVENTLDGQRAYEQQVAETQARIEQCFAGIESCVDKTVESVAYRLAEQAKLAIVRFDEGITARQEQLAEIDGRIATCAEGINGICEMVEQVQASVGHAVASNQQTLDQLQASATEAKRLLSLHDQARRSLSADLHTMREEVKAIDAAGKATQETMRDAVILSTRAETALRQRLSEVGAVAGEADRMAGVAAELTALLQRLQPWEKLLLSGTINSEGLPEPLARVAGEVKQQISQDMNWLSMTMRDVAERVSSLASAAPSVPPAAAPAVAEAPPPPEVQVNVKKPLRLRTFNTGA